MSSGKRGVVERTKNHFAKPSTHVGAYFAGWGGIISMSGGAVKGVYDALYAEGPLILADAYMGSWQDVAYHLGEAVGRTAVTSALFAEAGLLVGYAGGSFATDRMLGYVSSFLGWIFGRSKGD